MGAPAFDVAGITITVGCPCPSRTLRRAGTKKVCSKGFRFSNFNFTVYVPDSPCKERKDGAPGKPKWNFLTFYSKLGISHPRPYLPSYGVVTKAEQKS